jgi:flavodoxin
MYDIGNQVLYIFKFPEEYLHEYNCLKNSKYSEFKDDAKELILEFWTVMYGENPNSLPFLTKVKDILFKTTKYRQKLEQSLSSRTQKIVISSEAELGDIIDIENETFDFKVLENIKTKLNKDTEMW